MTDETKAVARAIMEAKGGCIVKDWQAERRDNPHVELAWNQAQAAIAALDNHRIDRAGEVEKRLLALKWMVHDEMRGLIPDTTAHDAAATIAAQKAQIERLERALRSIAWPMNEAGPWAQAVAASALPDTKADSDGDDGA